MNNRRAANRTDIADTIVNRLTQEITAATESFHKTSLRIGYFVVDDLLDAVLARQIYAVFPAKMDMTLKKSLREYKYITAQMNQYHTLLEETIYAFHDPRVVKLISEICNMHVLYPDEHLYAGGISLMGFKNFLNPHIDNSHDHHRHMWRVLNLLYYVTPDWDVDAGGNLELWSEDPPWNNGSQNTIHSKFNRLVVMATHQQSWHSVSPVTAHANRCCVSNYFFSPEPVRATDQFHVTSFRGRPEQRLRDMLLQVDGILRMGIRTWFHAGLAKTTHIYTK